MKKTLILLLFFFPLWSFSQRDTALVKMLNPASVHPAKGYSHLAEVDLGNCSMLIISGQIALDRNGNLVGQGSLPLQAEQVFINLRSIVSERGGTLDDVVRIGIYMTDIAQVQAMREVRNRFFNPQKPPASTLVQVSKLVREELLIEVEATAIIPKKSNQ